MTFKKRVITIISQIKNEKFHADLPKILPIYNDSGDLSGFLKPVTKSILKNSKEIELLAKWRKENEFAFPSKFKITFEGTKKWTQNQLLLNKERILFFVESLVQPRKLIGHMGLCTFDFEKNSCEIDNVVRGEKNYGKGLMTLAMNSLVKWTISVLNTKHLYLRVFSDNTHAVEFYKHCSFRPIKKIPLLKKIQHNFEIWEESPNLIKAEKYFLKMEYKLKNEV